MYYKHTSEILRIWFQTTAMKQNCNKVSHTNFLSPNTYKRCLDSSVVYLKCVITLSKNNVYILIKEYFIAKRCYHLSLQGVIIFLPVEGLASVLVASD